MRLFVCLERFSLNTVFFVRLILLLNSLSARILPPCARTKVHYTHAYKNNSIFLSTPVLKILSNINMGDLGQNRERSTMGEGEGGGRGGGGAWDFSLPSFSQSGSSAGGSGEGRKKSLLGFGKSRTEGAPYTSTPGFFSPNYFKNEEDPDTDASGGSYSTGSRTPPGFEDDTFSTGHRLYKPKSLGATATEFSTFNTQHQQQGPSPPALGGRRSELAPAHDQKARSARLKRCVTFAESTVKSDSLVGRRRREGAAATTALLESARA